MAEKIKVFHIEDYRIMREGIRHLLSNEEGIAVVGDAQNGDGIIRKLQTTKADVVILDIFLEQWKT